MNNIDSEVDRLLDMVKSKEESVASSSAGLPGFDMPHTGKGPLKIKKKKKEYIDEKENRNTDKRIMIDFDGTIHSYEKGWQDGEIYGHYLENSKEVINELYNDFEIVIFTARASKTQHEKHERDVNKTIKNVEDWLNEQGIKFDFITAEKLPAIVYIDDKAIEFKNNWLEIHERIKSLDKDISERGL